MGRWTDKIQNQSTNEPSKPSKGTFESFEGLPLPTNQNNYDDIIETISNITANLPITVNEFINILSDDDIKDWSEGYLSNECLKAFAQSFIQRREMTQGIIPSSYTKPAVCKQCGPVWLWFTGEVQGCPWCWNRTEGSPIPRPQVIQCSNCIHFDRIDHPNLGHCTNGRLEPIAGLWDSDQRTCLQWQPLKSGDITHD